MAADWRCWLWRFSNRRAHCFVGVEGWPEAVWSRRHKVDSALTEELRKQDIMPYPEEVLSIPTYGNRARAVRRSTEEALRCDGWKLLSARDRKTIVAGNLKPRPLYAIYWGRQSWFPSLAQAARALGVSEDALRRKCEDGIEARWDPCTK